VPNKKHVKEENEEAVMGVVDHIREFRNRLFVIVIVFFVAMLICLKYAAPIVELLKIPSGGLYSFIYISPSELFYQYIRVSIIGGIVVAAPVIIYELLAFASPGLNNTEKVFIRGILALGLIFFVLGVLFAYEILLPFMLKFFITINNNSGIEAQVSIEKYLSLCLSILSMLGIVFEMPVLTILLTQLGFLKPEWLKKSRRIVIVVCFIIAAIITPPDVVSQVMVAIPMLGLFEISIIFSTMVRKRKDKAREKRQEEAEKYRYQ
jgi:sec-independent protein translocase protein TatC